MALRYAHLCTLCLRRTCLKQSKLLSIVRRFATASLCTFLTSENRAESCLSAKHMSCKVTANQHKPHLNNCQVHIFLAIPSPDVKSVCTTLTLFAAATRFDFGLEWQPFARLQPSLATPGQTATVTAGPFRTSRSIQKEAPGQPGTNRGLKGKFHWKLPVAAYHRRRQLHRSHTMPWHCTAWGTYYNGYKGYTRRPFTVCAIRGARKH